MAKGDVDTYHEDGQWKNKVEGNSRASSVHDTKKDAQAAGRDMAKSRGVEHVIKKMDGTIGDKNSYGNDPRSSKALSAREVRIFLDSLRRDGVGARTIVYVHATLRAALADALREELVERNVATLVKVARPAKTEPAPLSVDEVKELFKHVHDHRLRAMFVVFALLGLRRSEVLGLQWTDINLDEGWLQVRRGLQRLNGKLVTTEPKTARSRRTIPLPAFVVESLKAHRKAQEVERKELSEKWPTTQFVFTSPIGTPLDPRNCTRIVQNECERAGLRRVRLHDFRHGAVSVLLGLGVQPRTVMEIVGHSTIEMTMNVYAHVSLDEKREALNLVGELFGEGEK